MAREVRLALTVGAVALATASLSFGVSREVPSSLVSRIAHRGYARSRDSFPYVAGPSGRYLVAFLLLSSECGLCREKGTESAIHKLRATLVASHGGAFARVSVIGIAVDQDGNAGFGYLRSLGKVGDTFDQVSVGGTWLNELVTNLVWRRGVASPAVPQVVLVQRTIDMGQYPDNIGVTPDSLLLDVLGRDSLIAWVGHGAPLRRHR